MNHTFRIFAIAFALLASLARGQVVSTIKVAAPAPVVRATVPLPPGTPWDAASCPFVLAAQDGSQLRTQWESVATYPDGTVRIAEVLANALQATGPQTYTLKVAPRPDSRARSQEWAAGWIDVPPQVYFDGEPRATVWSSSSHRFGGVAITRRFFGANVFGWVTAYDGLDVVQLELVLHNGLPGSPDLFFDELEIGTAAGPTVAESAWPDPGVATQKSGRLQLVGQRFDGYAHALVQRGAHYWSLVLHDGSQAALARSLAAGAGWGVATTWTDVDAYAAASLRLPDLGYRAVALAADLRKDWTAFASALSSGAPVGMTSSGVGRVDWQHPWNPKYGGVTGGGYRYQWHGVDLAATGEPSGLLLFQARLSTLMDRHAVSIVQPNGFPIALEQWLDASGGPRGWSVSGTDARFGGTSDGAFGFAAVQSVSAGPRTPPELAHFKQPIAGSANSGAFYPIDFQHWDRALQDAEALVQLSNSPVAAWWLRMNAETWRMSMVSGGRIAGALAGAKARPGWGGGWGRAHAHGMRFAVMAYVVSDANWRSRWDPFLGQCSDVMLATQTEAGLWKRDEVSKNVPIAPFNGQYALTKGTEEGLLANAVLGLGRSVRQRPASADALVAAVDRWSISGLWQFLWNGGQTGAAPTDYVAMAPKGGAPFASGSNSPRLNADREEIASPLGSAMLLRSLSGVPWDAAQVFAAQRWCGGSSSPLAWLKAQSNYKLKLDDCSPLHAALELGQ